MINITLGMILFMWFNYHISCLFLVYEIRKDAVPDLCRQTVPQRGVVNDGVWFDTKEPERGQGGMSEKYELSVQIFPERIRPLNSRK